MTARGGGGDGPATARAARGDVVFSTEKSRILYNPRVRFPARIGCGRFVTKSERIKLEELVGAGWKAGAL